MRLAFGNPNHWRMHLRWPEAIIDTRICQLRNRFILEYLIKWRKLSAEDSTWEDESFIQKHPELLKRCGQHLSQGEGHVKP
jgi:hypothetical protein